jgi:hypothetical protein
VPAESVGFALQDATEFSRAEFEEALVGHDRLLVKNADMILASLRREHADVWEEGEYHSVAADCFLASVAYSVAIVVSVPDARMPNGVHVTSLWEAGEHVRLPPRHIPPARREDAGGDFSHRRHHTRGHFHSQGRGGSRRPEQPANTHALVSARRRRHRSAVENVPPRGWLPVLVLMRHWAGIRWLRIAASVRSDVPQSITERRMARLQSV